MAFITPDFTAAAVALSALSIVSLVALRGWRDWIQLKREELAAGHAPAPQDQGVPNAGSRIEIADLKERLRKLEAIAAGATNKARRHPLPTLPQICQCRRHAQPHRHLRRI